MVSLMIRASAGSGKTFQLSNRFLALLAAGAEPGELIALTFTRKAAGEFADRILWRLAEGAMDEERAGRLAAELADTLRGNAETGMPGLFAGGSEVRLDLAVFRSLLEGLARELHRVSLGTLDSFFVRIARSFPYELGLAEFRLLEEDAMRAEQARVLGRIFREAPERQRRAFLGAFRLATHGREHNRLYDLLDEFLERHHQRYLSAPERERWGNLDLIWPGGCPWPEVEDFERAAEDVVGLLGTVGVAKKAHATWVKGWESAARWFAGYAPGDGKEAPSAVGRTLGLLEELAEGEATDVFSRMEHRISGELAQAMVRLVGGYLRAEVEARATRTAGLWSLLWAYESFYEAEVRRRGSLGFADVTRLLAKGGGTGDGRARMEWRLDARYRQWLLDEFQDTSREQWEVLEGLLDEAVLDPEGERSLFVVGDAKQGIYGWRGGEPRLFDDLLARPGWGERLREWGMEVSWRSAQEVLDLVNRVCDPEVMRGRFPDAAVGRWKYVAHRSGRRDARGYAVVVDTGEDEAEEDVGGVEGALRDLLAEVRPMERGLSCAVLVRSNARARRLVDFLRQEFPGMPVEMDAEVELGQDSPVGVAVLDLFRWLAHPADRMAREHVMASPLGPVVGEFGEGARAQWHACRRRVLQSGMAGLLQEVAVRLGERGVLNAFLEQRLAGILRGALDYDESGGRDFDEWVGRLEVLKQREYSAEGALQVMTVHKAKGLEFDMVVLPDLGGGAFDDPSKAGMLEFRDEGGRIEGLLLPPGRNLLEADAALARRFEAWSADQCYERFCNLYVGLTRARYGSYVLLPKAPGNLSSGRRYDLWIRSAVGEAGGEVVWSGRGRVALYEEGDAGWYGKVRGRERIESFGGEAAALGAAVARRVRATPSGEKEGKVRASAEGLAFGRGLHSAFERVGWVDEEGMPALEGEAGRVVAGLLEVREVREVFERRGRTVELFREQPVEAVFEGTWLSGVIDRLHVVRDGEGKVAMLEVIDFKTDAVESVEILAGRYAGQMGAYREVLAKAFGGAPVRCLLLAARLGRLVEVE